MKKVVCFALGLILMAATAFAQEMIISRASAVKTESALIHTGGTMFSGILVATDGTNAVTLDVYDGTTTGGTKIIPQIVIPTSSSNRSFALSIDPGVLVRSGIYVAVTCSGTVGYTVYYK